MMYRCSSVTACMILGTQHVERLRRRPCALLNSRLHNGVGAVELGVDVRAVMVEVSL
jgi:hypothetical protein